MSEPRFLDRMHIVMNDEEVNSVVTMKARYEKGEFPECFHPCPPFYDICNVANFEKTVCNECYDKFGFLDYIE